MQPLGLIGAILVVGAGPARAEEGFAANRFEPAERGSDWFGLESLDMRGRGRWAAGLVGDWAHHPLVFYDGDGNRLQAVLGTQMYAHLGGSAVYFDRLRVALSVPLVLLNLGDPAPPYAPDLEVAHGANLGDLRVSADVRVLGTYGEPLTLAVGGHVYLPTGRDDAFTGDDSFRAQPHLLLAGRAGRFEYAAKTGVNLRSRSRFVDMELGNEWVFAAAAGMRVLDDRLLVGPELWGGTLIDSIDDVFDKEGTPLEALLGAHYRVESWTVGLGAGPGLSRGLGTPELRALASVAWLQEPVTSEAPPPPPPPRPEPVVVVPTVVDTDADQIVDAEDACPNERGVPSTDAARRGCPDVVAAAVDPCAQTAPDGTRDPACSTPLDQDADGIADGLDACIADRGVASEDPQRNGCPLVRVSGDQLELIDRIEFENNRALLRPESESVLAAVLALLEQRPEITHVDIQGHTDSRGHSAQNLSLSRQRAAAVRDWLIAHGVAAARLESHGFGSERPLGDNDTEQGRQRNRRVEFHVFTDAASSP